MNKTKQNTNYKRQRDTHCTASKQHLDHVQPTYCSISDKSLSVGHHRVHGGFLVVLSHDDRDRGLLGCFDLSDVSLVFEPLSGKFCFCWNWLLSHPWHLLHNHNVLLVPLHSVRKRIDTLLILFLTKINFT